MIRINITEDMRQETRRISQTLPILDRSIRGQEANIVGRLGEVVAESWLRDNNIQLVDQRDRTTHDYLLPDGLTSLEIKTKDRTVPLQYNYECTVPAYNHDHQRPDYYLFISLLKSKDESIDFIDRFTTAYIAGSVTRDQFNAKSRFFRAGDIDQANNMTIRIDCHNIFVSELTTPEDTIKQWARLIW